MSNNASIAIGLLSGMSIFVLSLAFWESNERFWYLPFLIVLLFIILIILYVSDNKEQVSDYIYDTIKEDEEDVIYPLSRAEREYLKSEKIQEHREELWNIMNQMNSSQ